MTTCPSCGQGFEGLAAFCPHCGASLSIPRVADWVPRAVTRRPARTVSHWLAVALLSLLVAGIVFGGLLIYDLQENFCVAFSDHACDEAAARANRFLVQVAIPVTLVVLGGSWFLLDRWFLRIWRRRARP